MRWQPFVVDPADPVGSADPVEASEDADIANTENADHSVEIEHSEVVDLVAEPGPPVVRSSYSTGCTIAGHIGQQSGFGVVERPKAVVAVASAAGVGAVVAVGPDLVEVGLVVPECFR